MAFFPFPFSSSSQSGEGDKTASPDILFTRVNCTIYLRQEEDRERFLSLGKELVAASRNDEGCLGYDMMESVTDSLKFFVLETWKNRDVLELHMKQEHFTRIIPEFQKMAVVEIDAFDQVSDAKDNGKGFRLNIPFVIDVKDKAAIIEHALPLVEGSLKEEQCTGYDYFFSVTAPDQGLLFEDWPSQEALDFHMQTPHFLEHFPGQIQARYKTFVVDRLYK